MIQFLGIAFAEDRVDLCFLGRDSRIAHRRSTPLANAAPGAAGGIIIPPAEWIRASSYLCRDAYLDLDVADRKVWGLALAGPTGWIAIGRDLAALSDIRLMPAERIADDIRAWLDEDRRRRAQIEALLAPKDWFRFAVSGALAWDATTAARTGWTGADAGEWSDEELSARGMRRSWMPPIFPCAARTGQLTDDGMEQLGLQGRSWMVAGAELSVAAELGSGDTRGSVWASKRFGAIRFETGATGRPAPVAVADFIARPSAFDDSWSLERAWSGDATAIAAATADLGAHAHDARSVIESDGDPALGAAMLAARSSGLVSSWDRIFRACEPPAGSPR